MKLKRKISQEEFDALDPVLQAVYKAGGDGYELNSDDFQRLERSLASERRQHDADLRLLAQLVPGIVDDSANSGYVDRDKWRELVDDVGDILGELGDDPTPESVRARLDAGADHDPDETQEKLRGVEAELRDVKRQLGRAERERDTATNRSAELETTNQQLVLDRDLGTSLDEINVTDPKRRKLARLVLKDKGIKVEDGETLVSIDGAMVPLSEFAKDWATTDEGKEFVSAAKNRGGGDGGPVNDRPKDVSKMTAHQKLDAAFEGGAGPQ